MRFGLHISLMNVRGKKKGNVFKEERKENEHRIFNLTKLSVGCQSKSLFQMSENFLQFTLLKQTNNSLFLKQT